MSTRHNALNLRLSAFMAALLCALCITAMPAVALADQPDTDIVCGTAESERQDAAADRPDISAPHAIVVGKDGTVYYERAADEQVKIASITKVMTAIVALDNAPLDTTITVDHAAATVGQSSADLKEGDTMTLETALRALLIPSGNDAGMAIAHSVGAIIDPSSDDPYGTFIDAMNKKAQELGMDSKFTNPHGLDFDGWEGGEIYTVVLGCDGDEVRFADTLTLANWYYDHIVDYPAVTSNMTAADGQLLVARATDSDWTDKTIDVTAKDPTQTAQIFSLAGEVKQKLDLKTLSGDIKRGDDAGTLTLVQDGHTVATVKLVCAQDQAAPNPLEWCLVQLDRLFRLVTGQPQQAESSLVATAPSPLEIDGTK